MNAETLRAVMLGRISLDLAGAMLPHYTAALLAAGATTVNRAAMFGAQVGHESASLRYMEEIASGAAYEGRRDLGNVYPGDGRRFKGRGPIQLTGRSNYGAFSRWCAGRGLVASPTWFVDHPLDVATPRWGFLAAAWYWTVARPKINGLCDRGDLEGVSRQVNGGLNGLADRRARWNTCLRLGDRLLPGTAPAAPAAPAVPPPPRPKAEAMLENHPVVGSGDLELNCPIKGVSSLYRAAWLSVRSSGPNANVDAWWGLSDVAGRGEVHWHGIPTNSRWKTELTGGSDKPGDGVDQLTVHYDFGPGIPGVITLELIPKGL